MIQINQIKLRVGHSQDQLQKKIMEILMISEHEIINYEIIRRSIDARKKPDIFFIYSIEVSVKNENVVYTKAIKKKNLKEQINRKERVVYQFPEKLSICPQKPPVVIGAGPSGLFCAYLLALAGCNPILLERGYPVEDRQTAVKRFWETGILDPASNVQFGEGGAGTFSDGKLNTLVKDKDGRNRAVLETFVKFGASKEIIYDSKPHIGTDVLSQVVRNMRKEIIALGGDVRFRNKVTDFIFTSDQYARNENSIDSIYTKKIKGVIINHTETLECDQVVLAIGHSARDTFHLLEEKNIPMEAKSFAVGFRVEHPQSFINKTQYGAEINPYLGAAPYKVTAQASNGRGVYSFCMCPGGHVVNASSEEGYLAVNGMSYSKRDSNYANSAIIVSVTPDDFGSDLPLAGVEFQRKLEQKAFQLAQGNIPVEYYGDFKAKVLNDSKSSFSFLYENDPVLPCGKGKRAFADLTGLLPEECNKAFIEGMEQFGRQISGFNRDDALLSGIESRTSSPVRITRNKELQSIVKGFYPCGEGAGYAGGITSAAMDGMRIAEEILSAYSTEYSLTDSTK